MNQQYKLSELVGAIQETIESKFEGHEFWVSSQITNVKKYEHNRRCYLTLEEYGGGRKTAEARAVFWANTYGEIERFEKTTKQQFISGIEIICRVKVRFHPIYGLNLDVTKIDVAHTLGTLAIERQQTLDRLVKENAGFIKVFDGVFTTPNKQLPLPLVITNIALITAHNSDGQRDFIQELTKNKHGYHFNITSFTCTIQGLDAHRLILEQLNLIASSKVKFDAVAIIRGGGSQTDFKPFDDYDLAQAVALFSTPIFTGIGHDRNQSIIDLMARELKTPTKVASYFVEHNFDFENKLIALKSEFYSLITNMIENAEVNLIRAKQIIKLSSPKSILDRGFAMIMKDNKIITDPKKIKSSDTIQTVLKDKIIHSLVTKNVKNT